MINTHIGSYKIIRELAQDDIGQAFEAVDQTHNKRVTLKYLRPDTANSEGLPRLYSEAKTLALLNHPNIARLFGFVRRDDRIYLVMEFIEGETLEKIFKKTGRFQTEFALALFHQIIPAVGFAHQLGVIHGNLKPSNILVTNLGLVKILDFTIAHILRNSNGPGPKVSIVRYMSPEQIRGDSPDARSDIYLLGMLLYELIVGKGPFDIYSHSHDAILKAQVELIPVPPSVFVTDIRNGLMAFCCAR